MNSDAPMGAEDRTSLGQSTTIAESQQATKKGRTEIGSVEHEELVRDQERETDEHHPRQNLGSPPAEGEDGKGIVQSSVSIKLN